MLITILLCSFNLSTMINNFDWSLNYTQASNQFEFMNCWNYTKEIFNNTYIIKQDIEKSLSDLWGYKLAVTKLRPKIPS